MEISVSDLVAITKGIKVLYVEDDEQTREEIASTLSYFFDDIYLAKNGQEGLDKYLANKEDIELVITDIIMPKMDGLEMIEKIRDIDQGVSILLFSAYGDIKHLTKAIELSVDGFLSKPILNNQYLKVIFKVANNINNKKELNRYKESLEEKVNEQVVQLRLKDEMLEKQAKLAAMGEMIDIIAHQWKQPLNIISMRSSFLEEISKMDNSVKIEDVLECSSKVSYQISHLVDTLQEFRSFFRPIDKFEHIDLEDMFRSIDVLLHDDLMKNQIALEKELGGSSFFGNINEFKHLFINLINNARDAFVQNKIENRKININAEEKNGIVTIKIKDNAGGVPDKYIKSIFEPNFTTKKSMGGTGIGLYICKIIVSKHHGNIGVSCNDGSTCFILSLPVNNDLQERQE